MYRIQTRDADGKPWTQDTGYYDGINPTLLREHLADRIANEPKKEHRIVRVIEIEQAFYSPTSGKVALDLKFIGVKDGN